MRVRYGLLNALKKRLGRLGTTREIRGWKKPWIKPITSHIGSRQHQALFQVPEAGANVALP